MTSLFERSAEALGSLVNILMQLPQNGCYAAPCTALSDASIGQHTRHVIELYQCLLAGYESGTVNYDDRKRNTLYEQDSTAAVDAIREILQTLQQPDKALTVCFGEGAKQEYIGSNYHREVLYNLEHCIHHQALIKVALLAVEHMEIGEGFGIAYSTMQYRQQCAQ